MIFKFFKLINEVTWSMNQTFLNMLVQKLNTGHWIQYANCNVKQNFQRIGFEYDNQSLHEHVIKNLSFNTLLNQLILGISISGIVPKATPYSWY